MSLTQSFEICVCVCAPTSTLGREFARCLRVEKLRYQRPSLELPEVNKCCLLLLSFTASIAQNQVGATQGMSVGPKGASLRDSVLHSRCFSRDSAHVKDDQTIKKYVSSEILVGSSALAVELFHSNPHTHTHSFVFPSQGNHLGSSLL